MSDHTQAPWQASQFGGSITGPDGKSVCAISTNIKRPRDEKMANARLIAGEQAILAARAAIAKAENSQCRGVAYAFRNQCPRCQGSGVINHPFNECESIDCPDCEGYDPALYDPDGAAMDRAMNLVGEEGRP